jgi:hypothetical protein
MATIYISDVLELVALTVELQAWEVDYGPPELAGSHTFTWPGVGATEPHEWLARALFLAAEELTQPPPKGRTGAGQMGGTYTISETGDIGI